MPVSPGAIYVIMKHRRERRAKLSPEELAAEDKAEAAQMTQMKRDAKWFWFLIAPAMIAPLIWLGWLVFLGR